MRTFALILAVIVVTVVTVSASARADSVNMGVEWHIGSGPPCNVGGNPDERACISSSQDNVAPLALPWLTVVRDNASQNWSVTYGAWVLNSSALFEWTNARSADIDLSLAPVLHNIFNRSEGHGGTVSFTMTSDTAYVTITVQHVEEPESVRWGGENLTWRYDPTYEGGGIIVTPQFSSGILTFHFFGPAGGGTPTMLPFLPGLTNFQQFDLIPNVGQIASFSCDNVTLTDPRSTQDIAATRLWVFDWGDGTAQTRTKSPVANHLYGSPGTYNVTMAVQTANGTGLNYAGAVDTTPGSCAFHIARSIGFVVLTAATGLLIALSFILPKRTKKEKKRMRRQALVCAVAVILLVVVL